MELDALVEISVLILGRLATPKRSPLNRLNQRRIVRVCIRAIVAQRMDE
jgi:hypothetical protein